jgi:hypothetical protein
MLKTGKAHLLLLTGLMVVLCGCITVQMPQYLKDKNPYYREFYVDYDKTLKATIQALENLGWKVTKQTNPMVFESDSATPASTPRQVLLFTNMRQKGMIFGSCYRTLNVLLKENNEKTDVEVRYFSIFSTVLKNFESYKDDALVRQIFEQIESAIDAP